MQQNYLNLVRKYGVKFLYILLFWVLFLLFILKVYLHEADYLAANEDSQLRRDASAQRKAQSILANFSQYTNFPEIQLDAEAHKLSHSELVAAIEAELPALPIRYWYWNEVKKLQMSPNCSQFPNLMRLNYYNKYWQTFQLANITFQLYNAYFDDRPTVAIGATVRILAMINTTDETFPAMSCQLWYEEQMKPVITKVAFRMIWYAHWGGERGDLYPYLITCLIPADARKLIPKAVSLVSNATCERAANSLRVNYDKPKALDKQEFAVCVKGLDFPNKDISARLVEWIELQQVLGAGKIFFYLMQVHPNVTKVLQYYTARGVVEVKPITLASGEPDLPQFQNYLLYMRRQTKRLNELITYNDCFYRNLYKYKYIANVDIDEVLMPLANRTTWAQLIAYAAKNRTESCKKGYASYCFLNVYFPNFDNETGFRQHSAAKLLPSYMYMLQHVQRSSAHLPPNQATKCIHRTSQVLTLHNHYPLGWLDVCPAWTFPTDVGQLQHYRHEDKQENLTETVQDMSLWRYKDNLLERSLKALQEMHFFNDSRS